MRRDNRKAIGRERHQRQFCWRPREIRDAVYISPPRRGQVGYRAPTTAACGARDSLNLCVGGHSPISVAAYHGRVNTVACLLSMEGVEINGMDVIDPPICRAVAHGHLDVVRLLVQQDARLNINESTIATHDTALCIAAGGGDLEMVQALLSHDRIDVNLRNRCSEDPLMLAVKGGHSSIVDALVVNPRLKYFSLKRSLDLTRNDCIQRAIRSRMEDANTPQRLLKRSPREKVWWSVRAGDIYFG